MQQTSKKLNLFASNQIKKIYLLVFIMVVGEWHVLNAKMLFVNAYTHTCRHRHKLMLSYINVQSCTWACVGFMQLGASHTFGCVT